MELAPFYYWLLGTLLVVGLVVSFNMVFNKKKEKPTYNFRDEKRVMEEMIPDEMQPIYELLLKRFREMNPLKLKKLEDDSYELESRSIVSFLNECNDPKEVFTMMDEEFYRWNWQSPLYDEFYDALTEIADEVWNALTKKG
jgi:hypothetical protein